MAWPWSSRECAISGIDPIPVLLLISAYVFISCACAATIHAGTDIQASIEKASIGDTILVGPGQYSPFEVDRPLKVQGVGQPAVQAAVQRPGITVTSDSVVVSGFKIKGVAEDSGSKFQYYMQHPEAAALRLDLPNAGIIVKGYDATIRDTVIAGAQVGIFLDGADNSSLLNLTFERCGSGAELRRCHTGRIESCNMSGCDKAGLYIEQSADINLESNDVKDTANAGIFLKESIDSRIANNTVAGNMEGIALWNSSHINVSGNRAYQNYYGILVSESKDCTILDNLAEDNRRSEIVAGFGVGISLQANSSYNIVARNIVRNSCNGLEISRGCKFNVFFGNNATHNTHGIRADKSYNNLIYRNNFIRNIISVYDNSTHNIWNTTEGNYYSDYHGADGDGDGIGNQPYVFVKGDTNSADARPMIRPCSTSPVDIGGLFAKLMKYATYIPQEDPDSQDYEPYRRSDDKIIIESKKPKSPPKWQDSEPLF